MRDAGEVRFEAHKDNRCRRRSVVSATLRVILYHATDNAVGQLRSAGRL
jgi:hypothetical protein